jgi:glycosyltransferase involved in cell wall biosynthesis
MCTWKRIERLPITIELLEKQTNKDFTFCIWNNNSEIKDEIVEITNRSTLKIEVNNSTENIGGIGRFYYARRKAKKEQSIVIFIDDDLEFDENMVEYFVSIYKPKHLFSWHAWKIKGGYWKREQVFSGDCDYGGTCGMVIDSDVFRDERLFSELPEKYKFIEDLWLCFFAKYEHGYKIQGCTPGITAINDGKNQCVNLHGLKDVFYRELRNKYKER